GVGRGAQVGVLVRDAEALEVLEEVDVLIVDKTGTLTEGKPKLDAVEPVEGWEEADLLRKVAAVENASEHPLADAIVAGARDRELDWAEAKDFDSVTGKGAKATVDGAAVVIGNRAMMEDASIDVSALVDRADELRSEGRTVMFVGIDGASAGLVAVSDPIRETTPAALKALAEAGVEVMMVTGDNETTAKAVAQELGIDDYRADVLPEQKQEVVEEWQRNGHRVAMAGDGINDAPALAAADVGIAMGTGTDVAMESAGVTLVKGDLRGVARARRLSELTMRNIRQNLVFAFGYNALGVPVAAGVLYPVIGLLLSPMIAAAAMTFSSVSVIGNAIRLRWIETEIVGAGDE
ncbi:MAG: heavy metal translocating P-type ATPase, partial [Phycisphaeraceae bacterium]|nr:heavy metal translocating P-type ATPase [Phycisphaeraceae bacterium]